MLFGANLTRIGYGKDTKYFADPNGPELSAAPAIVGRRPNRPCEESVEDEEFNQEANAP